jgi:hypothetical protein
VFTILLPSTWNVYVGKYVMRIVVSLTHEKSNLRFNVSVYLYLIIKYETFPRFRPFGFWFVRHFSSFTQSLAIAESCVVWFPYVLSAARLRSGL